jgi:hypothetical protein
VQPSEYSCNQSQPTSYLETNIETGTMRSTIYFYSSFQWKEPTSFVFSQFHRAPFTTNGTTYWCNEQYYQACKAKVIAKYKCERRQNKKPNNAKTTCDSLRDYIMREKTSALRIAGMARDYVLEGAAKTEWESQQKQVLYTANYCKFKQNYDERAWLIRTGNAELVEASPSDRVCGIGYDKTTAEKNRHDWGTNLLGLSIERVRSELNQEMRTDNGPFVAVKGIRHLKKEHRIDRKHAHTPNDEIPPVSELASLPRGAKNQSKTTPAASATKRKDGTKIKSAAYVSDEDSDVGSVKRSEKRKAADTSKGTLPSSERNTKQPRRETKKKLPDSPLLLPPPPKPSAAVSNQFVEPPRSEAPAIPASSPKSVLSLPGNAYGPTKTYGPLGLTSPQLAEDRLRNREKVNKWLEYEDELLHNTELTAQSLAEGKSDEYTSELVVPNAQKTFTKTESKTVGAESQDQSDDVSECELDSIWLANLERGIVAAGKRIALEKELGAELPSDVVVEAIEDGIRRIQARKAKESSLKESK